MKMTLPFKPHVLALICSAGLCAASTGLYIKSRTVEAPVEPQSTQQTAPDITAVTLPATVSAPPVTPAVVKSAFSTAQIDQWVAPVALYPDSLLSQVLMASTYPANVAQAVQWSHDNPLKQGDAAIQAVSDQPWDASVKSLVAFPQLMALMGENPQWVQNLGDAFLAQPQDVMDSVQRLRQLAQQTGSLKSSTEQKVITTTKKAVPVKQTVTAPVIPSNTVLTASPVITEPATTVISIEPANPDVVYIPNYNPTVVYGNWANTAYPPVYLPPPAGEPFMTALCADSAIAWVLLPRTHYSAASTGTTTIMTIIIMTMMIIITTMAVIVTVMAGNTTATTSISTSTISTVSPVSILLIRIWHGGTIQTTVMVCPIMIRIWQSGFIKPMSTAE
ncbi:Protein of uncharacterised function (DUF3300) [Escherichia coli]|uniref:Protein of uncharacterized function (DUF3300) n=1 Tax=Escherichia coli TaxID=562 RepID=A0A376RNR7_ECOLX|nr:Protein of uncharacterised function (DUF3300) [Escherichia coli]